MTELCICHAAYKDRGLLDPQCRHDDLEDLLSENGRMRRALETISRRACGIPGHAVAVGCGAATIAWKALNAPDESMCPACEGRGYSMDFGPWVTEGNLNGADLVITDRRAERYDPSALSYGRRIECAPCGGQGWVPRTTEGARNG